jgi:hypothetical protein
MLCSLCIWNVWHDKQMQLINLLSAMVAIWHHIIVSFKVLEQQGSFELGEMQ